MEESLGTDLIPLHDAVAQRHEPPRAARFLRRAGGALVVSLLAFSATIFFLTRAKRPDPREVVQAHLAALARGDIHRAYEYFSKSYRDDISLEAFRHLVAVHRSLFRTREVTFDRRSVAGNRARLEVHIITLNGADYPAEYHLVRESGVWRIADFRYHLDSDSADSGIVRITVPSSDSRPSHGLWRD